MPAGANASAKPRKLSRSCAACHSHSKADPLVPHFSQAGPASGRLRGDEVAPEPTKGKKRKKASPDKATPPKQKKAEAALKEVKLAQASPASEAPIPAAMEDNAASKPKQPNTRSKRKIEATSKAAKKVRFRDPVVSSVRLLVKD